MKELFLQPLSLLSALSALFIIVWFLLEVLKKCPQIQVFIFAASHLLLYIDIFKFYASGFHLVSALILLLTLVVFLIKSFCGGFKINIQIMVYLALTVLLAVVFLFYFSLWYVFSII